MTGRYAAAKQFNFEQLVASDVWTIVHALGGIPIVDVFVTDPATSQLTRIIPEQIEYIDNTTVRVSFTAAQSGSARVMC